MVAVIWYVLCLLQPTLQQSSTTASVFLPSTMVDVNFGRHDISDFLISSQASGDGQLVSGSFTDSVESIGQGRLSLRTEPNPVASDWDYFYSLGLLEGYLTAERAIQHLYNIVWSAERQTAAVYRFFNQQYGYMQSQAQAHRLDDPFWFNVWISLARLEGLREGIGRRQREELKKNLSVGSSWQEMAVSFLAFYELNANSELVEIQASVNGPSDATTLMNSAQDSDLSFILKQSTLDGQSPMAEKSKCSALIKLVSNNSDLFVSHNTWTTYAELLRIYKTLSFEHVRHPSIRTSQISFASYPGYIGSTDDWIVTKDTSLVITETTNTCLNQELLKEKVSSQSVSTILRSLVASVTSESGRDWYNTFSRFNSGTYNNQWMIVDFKNFKAYRASKSREFKDVLWVVEQMPGLIEGKDMSSVLFSQGYWASYNRPFFPRIQEISGYIQAYERLGEWYHPNHCPRARLFRSFQQQASDLSSLQVLMTSNHWAQDPSSYHCPKNAIAGRYDLPGRNSSCGGVEAYGAIDCKITSYSIAMEEGNSRDSSWMVSSPSYGHSTPVFSWAHFASKEEVAHWGQPELWDFGWVFFDGSAAGVKGLSMDGVSGKGVFEIQQAEKDMQKSVQL